MSSPASPSCFIAIDPGLSTGVAVFLDGQLVRSFTTTAPHHELRSHLIGSEVLCEQGPTNHRRQAEACAPVEALVKQLANHVRWARPSDWKPSPRACLEAGDAPATKHERDAIRMGRWYLALGSTSVDQEPAAA